MQEKTCKTVRLGFGTALAALTVIVGALFIWQTLDIYLTGTSADYTGAHPYTVERVASRLTRIGPAFWLWIALIAVNFVIWEVFPVAPKKTAWKDPRYALKRVEKRIPADVAEDKRASLDYLEREGRKVKLLWLCCGAVCLAGIIYGIVYLSVPSHFPYTDVTGEILNMVKNLLPCAFAAFAVACAVAVYEGISAKKQLPHAKNLAIGGKPAAVNGKVYTVLHNKYFILGLRIGIGCIAVAFIIAGALNGNMTNILIKAINICSECIGLG